MKSIIIPLVKCKSGDLADVNNYRAIAVSTALSKLLENVLASFVQSANDVDAYQFGFTAGHSTSLCTSVFKRTVDYYRTLGSHIFVCFIDFTRGVDRVRNLGAVAAVLSLPSLPGPFSLPSSLPPFSFHPLALFPSLPSSPPFPSPSPYPGGSGGRAPGKIF
jgi:hypothetical protein